MTEVQLVTERIQALHPKCLIRDLQVRDTGDNSFQVTYLKVRKDDTYVRCTLHITTEPLEEPNELTHWDGDEADKIQY